MCCADWLLHEQVAVAAMDVHAIPVAHNLVTAVVNKYPKSARAARLKVRLYWQCHIQRCCWLDHTTGVSQSCI